MAKKEKVLWPSWYYSPEGQKKVFNGPEEVPEGWVSDLSELPSARRKAAAEAAGVDLDKPTDTQQPEQLSLEQQKRRDEKLRKTAEQLEQDHSQKELVAMLEEVNKLLPEPEQIEFLPNWPKKKLATAIVGSYKD